MSGQCVYTILIYYGINEWVNMLKHSSFFLKVVYMFEYSQHIIWKEFNIMITKGHNLYASGYSIVS